ncbi:MAG: VIT family protein [Chitinophagales bacterium]|nr:VIT family protein [Chitinophagales bacterium]
MDNHYIHRSNWLRAAVLGANDGILSVSSIAIGVVAANSSKEQIVLATLAGMVAGALSMAAGEYVSVSSQTDMEQADIEREAQEIAEDPESEKMALAQIYLERGLSKETALLVADELTKHDALGAHVRDELGINEITHPNPLQAALASCLSFVIGGILPLLVVLIAPKESVEYLIYAFSIVFLGFLGIVSAKTGGANILKAAIRIIVWGTIAMAFSACVGYLFGVSL